MSDGIEGIEGIERAQVAATYERIRPYIRVTPVVDTGRAFVEWWATFDCELDRCEERIAFFREAFAGWLESLRRHLNPRASDEDTTRCFGSSPVHTV